MPKNRGASNQRPPYIQFFRDRFNRPVCYFRRGSVRVRLRAAPYSDAWWDEYTAARSGSPLPPDSPPEKGRNRPGSWNALIASYEGSAAFINRKPKTHSNYRIFLNNIGATWGDASVRDTPAAKIAKWIGDKSIEAPGSARNLWTVFSVLCKHAVELGWRPDNPVRNIAKPKLRNPEGYETVDEVSVARWRKRHAGNFDAMWMLEGLLGTGARGRSDFRLLGWKDIADGKLQFRPVKTSESTGAWVRLPLRDKHLQAALATRARDQTYFLQQANGEPWDETRFAKSYRRWAIEAGWPMKPGRKPGDPPQLAYKMHSLRKLFATRMANKGASITQIAAALGDTPESVRHYIKTRDTDDLAAQAIDLIAEVV